MFRWFQLPARYLRLRRKRKITPQEIDRVVEEEILLSMHPDDAQDAVDYLKGQGATDYLIADAVARSLRKNINSTKEEEGWVKANAGIHWLEKLGDQNQISNLLYAAQVSTNIHASAAVRAFYRRLEDKGRFVSIADGLLSRPEMDQLKYGVCWRRKRKVFSVTKSWH